MTKRFLIIQLRPEQSTADNEFEAILRYGCLKESEVVRARVEQTGSINANLDDYAAIIVGGSPFDVGTPESEKSPIQKKIEAAFTRLFDEVVASDFPFLGACSGNGLLGSYCGATISTKYAEPVGAVDILLTDDGKRDQLLKGLPTAFRALVGHKEACDDVPHNAVLLAYSSACPVQMFRIKENIYATQFHPEGDVGGFTLRINVYKHNGYFPPQSADAIISSIENEDTPIPQMFLRRFVERYRI